MVDKNESIELDESQKINTKINGIDVNITKTLKYTNVIFNVYVII